MQVTHGRRASKAAARGLRSLACLASCPWCVLSLAMLSTCAREGVLVPVMN